MGSKLNEYRVKYTYTPAKGKPVRRSRKIKALTGADAENRVKKSLKTARRATGFSTNLLGR